MNLRELLYKITINSVIGDTNVSINEIHFDSRNVGFNDCFVAINGTLSNGHNYIMNAVNQGALAVICEQMPEIIVNGITYVQVENSQAALAIMAANFYGHPSEKLKLVGITGTNGKTTIASLLFQLFRKAGHKAGLLSTVKIAVDDTIFDATHTTPDPLTINYYLNEMVKKEVKYCFMEVSSHGIHQHRTDALKFVGGVFTNLTQDHLDYHNSFAEYRDVKKSFFNYLPPSAFALVNIDDKNGNVMLQNTKAKFYTYALKTHADFKAQVLESQFSGLLLRINENEVWTKLIGKFNAYNILAIYGTSTLLGLDKLEVLRIISELESVTGRFQYTISEQNITAIVDYAHTPDALKNVLETINDIRTGNETLITVVGCGGNRDKGKRPQMGHIASALSNKVIFTSDNPRNEEPETIIREMEQGVEPQNLKKTISITDRKQAIKTACQLAEKNDIILVAGKGHETYQEMKGKRIEFDDYKIVTDCLNLLNK
ncbi:MAG TPA: UDP-N-acetylmuramoyl-L-alanyl-D-glutamate--2,6-diaminopimelate ligase [Flavobacteriaceae bacterium]|nr:UDP-N-acetylmuramoyl-L-alanyl-D-glutamate--2,6-diaminopimelate ligase [Flavobacteriaceae bacterium]